MWNGTANAAVKCRVVKGSIMEHVSKIADEK
jgi:hypothetical protein